MGAVFGNGKAYTLGISNNKFRLSIASLVGEQWDFRNQTGISIDHEDLNRIISACEDIVRIMMGIKQSSTIPPESMLNVRHIQVPLVAKLSNIEYGKFIVGITDDAEHDMAFYIQYNYHQQKTNQDIEDYFIFKKTQGLESELQYFNANKEVIRKTNHKYLMFANFLTSLNALHRYGKMNYGLYSAMRFGGGAMTGNKSITNTSNGQEGDKPYLDDIPF
jgi:SNF2 family DNA or RNA helicase